MTVKELLDMKLHELISPIENTNHNDIDCEVLRVVGGWIYRFWYVDSPLNSESAVFVPEPSSVVEKLKSECNRLQALASKRQDGIYILNDTLDKERNKVNKLKAFIQEWKDVLLKNMTTEGEIELEEMLNKALEE